MDVLVGTPQCPHLGFNGQDGLPCCHADEATRLACGKWAPNPAVQGDRASANITGAAPFYCTVLGKEVLPKEALKLAAAEKGKMATAARNARPGFQPPTALTGRREARHAVEHDPDQPVIPTPIRRSDPTKIGPNQPCSCGSGRKYKKCCGRGG